MSDPTDFPYSPLRDALRSMLSRLAIVVVAAAFGILLGCLTASDTILQAFSYLLAAPLHSVLFGFGIPVFIAVFIFAILFVTWEWRPMLAIVATVLMWACIHDSVDWQLHKSPMAKIMHTQHAENSPTLRHLQRTQD